jgi:hypothetical protein
MIISIASMPWRPLMRLKIDIPFQSAGKITVEQAFEGHLHCKKGIIVCFEGRCYFMYSLGETENISLKQVEKYFGLLNPTA